MCVCVCVCVCVCAFPYASIYYEVYEIIFLFSFSTRLRKHAWKLFNKIPLIMKYHH